MKRVYVNRMRRVIKTLCVAAALIAMAAYQSGFVEAATNTPDPAVTAGSVPFRVVKVEQTGPVYLDSNPVWIPIDVYFSKPVADAGTPADYTVIFDRDGDFSTESDQVQVIPDSVSIYQSNVGETGKKVQVDLSFVPDEGGRFLVRVGEKVKAQDGSLLDPRYNFGPTYPVRIYRPGSLKLEKVRYLGPDPGQPDSVILVADFNKPVWGSVWKLQVTYDQDGDLSTTADVKPVKITATGDYWGPMENEPWHSLVGVDINDLRPGGRFKIHCLPGLTSADGDPIDPAYADYVTEVITNWGVPRSIWHEKFVDVKEEPLDAQVYALFLRGIIAGVDDHHFAPEEKLTRAQFAVLMDRALSKEYPDYAQRANEAHATFVDVPSTAWYKEAVERLAAAGFMQGTRPGYFSPEEKVTREQLLVTVSRIIALDPAAWLFDVEDQADLLTYYPDWEKISPWARRGVALALWADCKLGGPGGESLNPQSAATRADAAGILHQLLFPPVFHGHFRELAREVGSWQ